MNDPSESRDGRIAATPSEPAVDAQLDGAPVVGAHPDGVPATDGALRGERAMDARPHGEPAREPPAAGEDRAVDARTVAVWRWAALIGSMPIAGAAAIFTVSMAVAGSPAGDLLFIAYPLLLAALGLNAWWYPAARYRRLRYRLDPLGITITDGILWRTQSSVAQVRIQHTDISQGPLQRRYGVATLKLYTAGSRFTRIELPGLAYGDAVQLRDRLLEPGEGDAV